MSCSRLSAVPWRIPNRMSAVSIRLCFPLTFFLVFFRPLDQLRAEDVVSMLGKPELLLQLLRLLLSAISTC